MSSFGSISPNININTSSSQLRTELLNTFNRLDGQLATSVYKIFTLNGPVDSSGSVETDLFDYIVNQGTLNKSGSSIIIVASGVTAANANTKTLRLILGSTVLFTSTALTLNNVAWTFRAEIVFAGGTSQISYGEMVMDGRNPVVNVGTASEDFATNLLLRLTGIGTANGDIAAYYWKGFLSS